MIEPGRRHPAVVALVIGLVAGAAEVAFAFRPWVRTGERERSSFELIGVARRLGVLQGGWEHASSAAWYFVPFVVALALLALLIERRTVAAGLLVAAGAAGAAVGMAVTATPLGVLAGVRVTILAALVAAAAGVVALVLEVRHR